MVVLVVVGGAAGGVFGVVFGVVGEDGTGSVGGEWLIVVAVHVVEEARSGKVGMDGCVCSFFGYGYGFCVLCGVFALLEFQGR